MTIEAGAAPRVWVNPKGVFNSLVVLAGDCVVFGKPKGTDAAAVEAAVESGQGMKAIDLADVGRVRANRRNREVEVSVGIGKKGKSVNLEMVDETAQQELFQALQERLGSGWGRRHVEMSPMRAASAPAVGLLIIALLTFAASKGAEQLASGETVEVSGRHAGVKRLFVWLMETLGPTGIVVLGVVLALVAVAILIKRVRKPPVYDELAPN